MTVSLIQAEDVCYKSGKRYLLNHINWEVHKGEQWLLFGMNGSGKTTLLTAVAGFMPITSGKLTVLGETYNSENIYRLRKKVGLVSSSFFDKYFHNELPLHIVLSGLFGGFSVGYEVQDEDIRLAKHLLAELRMGDKMKMPFCRLSKGERQNILIARALISHPEILVMDEPGTGLDFYAREHMMQTVKQLAESGKVTVLYVTHYPEEIQPFMNKTMLLRNGRVFAQGDTENVLTERNISQLVNEPVTIHRDDRGILQFSVKAETRIRNIIDL